jgi:hypothetical protein
VLENDDLAMKDEVRSGLTAPLDDSKAVPTTSTTLGDEQGASAKVTQAADPMRGSRVILGRIDVPAASGGRLLRRLR